MIALRAVAAGGFRGASAELGPGPPWRLVTKSERDADLLLRLITGSARPAAGSVELFGESLESLPEDRQLALLRRVGFVWGGGGFVSNLKAWENILLPLWYHGPRDDGGREELALEVLRRLGMGEQRLAGFLQSLPGSLEVREQRFIGLARVVLQDSEAVVYEDVFAGLEAGTRRRMADVIAWHHGRRPDRTSVVLTAGEAPLPGLEGAVVLRQTDDGGIEG